MKKVILSRKGFDSKYGGKPSPIFNDGNIFSLPIPQNSISPNKYKTIKLCVLQYNLNMQTHYKKHSTENKIMPSKTHESRFEIIAVALREQDLFLNISTTYRC